MNPSFAKVEYNNNQNNVTWQGFSLVDNGELSAFMQREVANRLNDTSMREEFHSHLRSLSLTGMGKDSLEAVLNAEIPEEREWAVGEALAEALLIRIHGALFPWNMERDKRNSKGSLPGADIIGFIPTGSEFRLALGEVKTSGEEKYPPQVVSGRSGLHHQIDNLANNMSIIYQILFWLHPRVKSTDFQATYDQALILYFNSNSRNKAVALFGVLIRDTKPNEMDLNSRANLLARSLAPPATCNLLAVYLPYKIMDLHRQTVEGDMS